MILCCCYITVDSAMVASQNRFRTYKLSFPKKINITQKMGEKIDLFTLIFYDRLVVKNIII
jgi:hypothetical protein